MSWWVWKNALRDTELEIEEADVLKVPAKVLHAEPQKNTTDTARPTCLAGTGARSESKVTVPPSHRPSSFCSTHTSTMQAVERRNMYQ